MAIVTMREAKAKLTELARRVEKGESITVTRNGKPVLQLTAPAKSGGVNWAGIEEFKKKHGLKKLVTWVSPDFDEPLPADFLSTKAREPKKPAPKNAKPRA
jgi:prevent-host-death family protein